VGCTAVWIIVRPSPVSTWLAIQLTIDSGLCLTHIILPWDFQIITLVSDITEECGKFGPSIGVGRTHEYLIRRVEYVPGGDCVAEPRVRIGKGSVWCNRIECGFGEESARGGCRESILDRRRHDDGGDCFRVVWHRSSFLILFFSEMIKFKCYDTQARLLYRFTTSFRG